MGGRPRLLMGRWPKSGMQGMLKVGGAADVKVGPGHRLEDGELKIKDGGPRSHASAALTSPFCPQFSGRHRCPPPTPTLLLPSHAPIHR